MKKEKGSWKLSKIEKAEICDLYRLGNSGEKIALKYSVTSTAIRGILKNRKISMRSDSEAGKMRAPKLNTKAFGSLNNESKYWLGFIFADGCIFRPAKGAARLIVTLANYDRLHLEKLRSYLEISKKIYERGGYSSLVVSSDILVEQLNEYGITPRKSLTAKVTDDRLINSRDFYRGLIDGDGCIWVEEINKLYTKKRFPRIELMGTNSIVANFATFVRTRIVEHDCQVRPIGSIQAIKFGGRKAMKIIHSLYDNSLVFLNRKKLLATEMINEFSG